MRSYPTPRTKQEQNSLLAAASLNPSNSFHVFHGFADISQSCSHEVALSALVSSCGHPLASITSMSLSPVAFPQHQTHRVKGTSRMCVAILEAQRATGSHNSLHPNGPAIHGCPATAANQSATNLSLNGGTPKGLELLAFNVALLHEPLIASLYIRT